MLKLATLIQNPGEPAINSRYRDPKALKELGYNALVIYETTALSGLPDLASVEAGDLSRWVSNLANEIDEKIAAAQEAGLAVYIAYDAMTFPESVVADDVMAMTCTRRPKVLCPSSELAMKRSVDALSHWLKRWPDIAGVVLRVGDNDAGRVPFLIGNDIYSPRCEKCRDIAAADRVMGVIDPFYERVVTQDDKQLILRAWNIRPGGLHDTPELVDEVIDRLPGEPEDKRLILSFKCTETDFWRYQPWNRASLRCGKRPVIYELQCQREFEGKGGVVNWQPPLWQSGQHEVEDFGLKQAAKEIKLEGLWAWVRGGGWGGPFIKDETWIDANVYAVPRLADNPSVDLYALSRAWIQERMKVEEPALVETLNHLLHDSPTFVREAFYIGPFARQRQDSWHPAADWIKDDLLDVAAARRVMDRLTDEGVEEAISEKRRAAEVVTRHRASLQHLLGDHHEPRLEGLVNSMMYTESLVEALRGLIQGFGAYRRFKASGSKTEAQNVRRSLLSAQSHWNHHTQRFSAQPGAATAFREQQFWEQTQDMLGEVMG